MYRRATTLLSAYMTAMPNAPGPRDPVDPVSPGKRSGIRDTIPGEARFETRGLELIIQ